MSKKPEPSSVRVRLATHAGSWYSHDEHELEGELSGASPARIDRASGG